ncbi:MAG: UDP-N-acetylmuramoylalanyl-D-glutamate--2,6-diaminopimelate ligase [Eggerthellaceae bacterium]|nr:UDP-N-acetylmuramoylalanyl-D-glutamate--2,6-diaminopimelate ligase [Eggerthellaceae bacterium]
MVQALACPACSATTLDVHDCESMMALGANTALFSLRCPTCGARISSIQPVPADMHGELYDAAVRVGAMGFLNAQ